MSYDICIWDPYAFERPQDYIPDSLEHAEYIRWEELLRKIKLSPNPKLLAFGKELEQLTKKKYFNDAFNECFAYAASEAEESAKIVDHRFILIRSISYHSSTDEHFLPMHELVQRYQLVLYDQDRCVVLLPNGNTIPTFVHEQLIQIERAVQRRAVQKEVWETKDVLPQRLSSLLERFIPQTMNYFAQFGYQPDSYYREYSGGKHYNWGYKKEEFMIEKKIRINIEGTEGKYAATMSFSLIVPAVGYYLSQVDIEPEFCTGVGIILEMGILHYQVWKHPSDVELFLPKSDPMLHLIDSIQSYEQVFQLWSTPAPLDPPEASRNQLPRGRYHYMYSDQFGASETLKSMILARMINKPAIYAPVIEHLYADTLSNKKLPAPKLEAFKRRWAIICELLDRDYPPSTD